MEDAALRVPDTEPPTVRIHQAPDSLSLRSAQQRIELLHDVTSIRSHRRARSTYIPPRKTLWERFKDAFRSVIAFVFSNVGICVLVLGYLILGAFMFEHLEAEERGEEPVVARRREAVARLWNITERYNTLHRANWSEEVRAVMADYQEEVILAVERGFDGTDNPSTLWTFSGALLYSITVITTIGYGHMVPVTPIGKIVTMIYAVIGVPLFLLYLSNIGEIFATSFKWTYSRLCRCQLLRHHRRRGQWRVDALPAAIHAMEEQARVTPSDGSIGSSICTGDEEEYEEEVDENRPEALNRVSVPISLSLTVMISYICGGAILFGELENWDFLNGSYFCFITLTTIGFGDMVPGDAVKDDENEEDLLAILPGVNLQFIFCSLYIIFGMAVIAMCFSLMQEKTVRGVLALGRKVGVIKTDPAG